MRTSDDPHSLIGDLIRYGVLDSVDNNAGRAVVKIGDTLTPPLRWFAFSGPFAIFAPAAEGEQVVVFAPEGDITHALILRGVPCDAFPAPASGMLFRVKFPNGTTFDYDTDTNRLTLNLTGGMDINAPEGATLTGDLNVTGQISATGKITSNDDVVTGDISLKDHVHGNVQAGIAKTGSPE